MKNFVIVVLVACAFPLGAAAEDIVMPRMLKDIGKGQWRMEFLENSRAKPGQKMPVMTMCTDNLLKQAEERRAAAKSESRCKQRLVKDGADEAIVESTCPERKITTTIRRESANVVTAEMTSAGERPTHMKMRYTRLGACREGQSTVSFDKDSEQCQKIRASVAKMDPAKTCAKAGDKQQCESMMQQQIARAKAMCE
ncbi:MAG TPA: hypothetical protein VE820_03420 [Sphingomicrobium sp.]|jgi:hypothetical protein|nr:hypothetical protein [Sphingomicrobium sp.]